MPSSTPFHALPRPSSSQVIPPIFGHCTEVVPFADELAARDAYWEAVLGEAALGEVAQADLLRAAIAKNPFIAEPHLLLAQIHFRNGRYAATVEHCTAGLRKLYALGTAWDKRRPYAAWVGFGRLLHVRAKRKASGLTSLPDRPDLPPTSGGLTLAAVTEIVKAMP